MKHSREPCHSILHIMVYVYAYLLAVGKYLEHSVPSHAQYGSLARQHSAHAFPYTSQRCKGIWEIPNSDPRYSCCCWQMNNYVNKNKWAAHNLFSANSLWTVIWSFICNRQQTYLFGGKLHGCNRCWLLERKTEFNLDGRSRDVSLMTCYIHTDLWGSNWMYLKGQIIRILILIASGKAKLPWTQSSPPARLPPDRASFPWEWSPPSAQFLNLIQKHISGWIHAIYLRLFNWKGRVNPKNTSLTIFSHANAYTFFFPWSRN